MLPLRRHRKTPGILPFAPRTHRLPRGVSLIRLLISSDEFKTASDIDTRTVKITFFPDEAAQSLRTADLTLSQLADRIAKQTAASKMELPWLKLAIFGNKRSEKNCLRTNDNVAQITGIETEHDAGEISFDTAIAVMRKARIRSLLYTSPSYVPATKERWRILVPLSQNYPAETREKLVARINGLFGGQDRAGKFRAVAGVSVRPRQ